MFDRNEKLGVQEFESQKALAPFLGTPIKFIPGQDPLGLLNVGENTYSLILQGMNNVTGRIRYYSFYCWFFDEYSINIGKPDKDIQRKYLRRAEYLLALIAVKKNWDGIPGILKARKLYNVESKTFNLKDGTGELKGTTEGSYWKNPGGIFGQNYVRSMEHMGLIKETKKDSKIYIRTDFNTSERISGKNIAVSFKDNISKDASKEFFDILLNAIVTQDQLENLSYNFNLKKVPTYTKEHGNLINLLIHKDDPKIDKSTFYRRRTIHLIAEGISNNKEPVDALKFVYKAYYEKGKINDQYDNTLILWYYFQIEQIWHIISTGSLKNFLDYLYKVAKNGWIEEEDLVKELSQEVYDYLKNIYKKEKLTLSDCGSDKLELELAKLVSDLNPAIGISNALILLNKLINSNVDYIEDLKSMAKKNNIYSESSFINSFADLLGFSNENLLDFIQLYLKKYIINRHQWIALLRMEQTQSIEKFVKEDGLIRFIDSIDFDYSASRIKILISFLEDLGVIKNKEAQLTAFGVELLNQLKR